MPRVHNRVEQSHVRSATAARNVCAAMSNPAPNKPQRARQAATAERPAASHESAPASPPNPRRPSTLSLSPVR
eukprot:15440523-Alexandrium_andersonii.AAC.1